MLLRLHDASSLGGKKNIFFFLVSGKKFYGLSIFFFFFPTEIKLDRKDFVKFQQKSQIMHGVALVPKHVWLSPGAQLYTKKNI
jgi:hypothetical protein